MQPAAVLVVAVLTICTPRLLTFRYTARV